MNKKFVAMQKSKSEVRKENVRIVLYALTVKKMRVAELAKALGLSRSTVNHYITELMEIGYVKKCLEHGLYCASKSGMIAGNTLYQTGFLRNVEIGMNLSLEQKKVLTEQLSFFTDITLIVDMVGK